MTDTLAAEQSLREGRLDDALNELHAQVRKDPANANYRVFLFQLLAILGDWNRALTQLNVAGELDAGTLAMVQTYRQALRCEVFRGEVFAGRRTPLIFGNPGEWMALLLEALRLTGEGQYAQSQQLRGQAFDKAPVSSGVIDDQSFEWIADADVRLGPVLEVILDAGYYWVPFEHIKLIRTEAPCDLRDLVWLPAQFIWANGGEAVGLIPSRYPESQESGDASIRLSKKTDWSAHEADLYLGLGQRVLATDRGEYPILDIRLLDINASSASGDAIDA